MNANIIICCSFSLFSFLLFFTTQYLLWFSIGTALLSGVFLGPPAAITYLAGLPLVGLGPFWCAFRITRLKTIFMAIITSFLKWNTFIVLLTTKLSKQSIETGLFTNLPMLSKTSWSESLTHIWLQLSTPFYRINIFVDTENSLLLIWGRCM